MRMMVAGIVALVVAGSPAFGQLTNLKQNIGNKLQNAEEQHNQDIERAMNGDQPAPPPPPPTANPTNPNAPLPIKTGWISRKSADQSSSVRLYFAYPLNLTPQNQAPGLIVLQEWWGLNDDVKSRTDDFAKRGFYAVAVDLYHGDLTADPKRAAELKNAIKDDQALVDMKTGVDLLEEEAQNGIVDKSRIGVLGWCMGGGQGLLLSLADDRIKATAIFYGSLVTDPDKLKTLQGPVLGVFGNNDTTITPDDVKRFKDALAAAGKTDVTIYQFDGVGHAFASKSGAIMGAYNPVVAKEAWDKTWTWLNDKLLHK